MSKIKPLARRNDIVIQEFGNEIFIYDLKANKAFSLNSTSSLVWQLCDGESSVSEISEKLTIKLNDLISEDLVWLTLEKLAKEELIENNINFVNPFSDASRREIIRRIGFATFVALPIISSLVAPTSVYAFSCSDPNNNANQNGPGCVCQSNNDCTNNCCGFGLICAVSGSVGLGGSCRVNCECASGNCVDPVGPVTGTCQP